MYSICRIFILLFIFGSSTAQSTLPDWKDQKYSMFIHFGAYAQLGGVYNGKQISTGLSEQIQAHAGIYSDTYERIAMDFNPLQWNSDSIARLARDAGMRSIVITSKHHDGFAIFNSAYTNFDIIDGSGFQRDIIAELSASCKKYGLRFGLYFSLIDWHYPHAYPISSHNSDPVTSQHHQYNLNQITELLSNYGPISELWFDMGSMTEKQSREMRELVKKLQPECMIGSRIGNDMGDFTVMGDNQEPDYKIGVPWQSPASFFHETWGYRSWQKTVPAEEKYREKLASLIRVVSRGGNYLLNIGPKGDGSVVKYEKDILIRIGDWLNKNGKAIYGTNADPFFTKFEWGNITTTDNRIFLHLLKQPENNRIYLPELTGKIKGAKILASGLQCSYTTDKSGITITLPSAVDISLDYEVIELEFPNGYFVPPANKQNLTDEKLVLNGKNAFKYYSNSGIDYNTRFQSTIREFWTLDPKFSGKRRPSLYYTQQEKGRQLIIRINEKPVELHLNDDPVLPIGTSSADIRPGKIYKNGPFYSGIEGVHGQTENITPDKPWPKNNPKSWIALDSTKGSLPAGMMTAYYLFQEIESDADRQSLVEITAGESLIVFINGEERLIYNDPLKRTGNRHTLLMELKKGKNTLLIKLFNNFNTEIPFGVNHQIPQIIYHKELKDIDFHKNRKVSISWQLNHPQTPHQHLNLPNLQLIF